MLSSHPLPETRIDDIKLVLNKEWPNGPPPNLTRGRKLPGTRG
jgi:hypothetical protein